MCLSHYDAKSHYRCVFQRLTSHPLPIWLRTTLSLTVIVLAPNRTESYAPSPTSPAKWTALALTGLSLCLGLATFTQKVPPSSQALGFSQYKDQMQYQRQSPIKYTTFFHIHKKRNCVFEFLLCRHLFFWAYLLSVFVKNTVHFFSN